MTKGNIVSPEQARRLSLKEHARAVVKQMEADLGLEPRLRVGLRLSRNQDHS